MYIKIRSIFINNISKKIDFISKSRSSTRKLSLESESTLINNRIRTEILIRRRRFDSVPLIALAYTLVASYMGITKFYVIMHIKNQLYLQLSVTSPESASPQHQCRASRSDMRRATTLFPGDLRKKLHIKALGSLFRTRC